MSRHRFTPQPADDDVEHPATMMDEDAADDDLPGLARKAVEHLQVAAMAADEVPQRAAEAAVIAAMAEAGRIAKRGYRRTVLAVLAVTLAVVVAGGVIAYQQITSVSGQLARLSAGEQASSDVADARASSLQVVRRDFALANEALRAAGLAPVPDPGPGASAYQIAIVTGEALGTLRAVGELQKKGAVRVPGVTVPDPALPGFPGPVDRTG